MPAKTHQIVILGGNFGGVNAAHYLLRQSIPTLQKIDSESSYRVTIITPNTHIFFKIAAPRTSINQAMIPVDKIFRPISESFERYGDNFRFIRGKATHLDSNTRKITVRAHTDAGESQTTSIVTFDSLIISTGTTSRSAIWSLHDNHQLSITALNSLYASIQKAKTVLICGGGAVGVETAGEIAHGYPSTKVTLISASERVLPKLLPSTSDRALRYLESKKVDVVFNQPVIHHTASADGATITLQNGTKRSADVYIDATGASKINTEYLAASWLDDRGRVFNRDAYFRVRGSGHDDGAVAGIYAIGDAVHGTENTSFQLDAMIPVVGSSIEVDICNARFPVGGTDAAGRGAGRGGTASYGLLGSLLGYIYPAKNTWPVQKEFKPFKDTIVVPVGPDGGVGQLFGWAMPSFMVKQGKAARFLMEYVEPWITGDRYAKAV